MISTVVISFYTVKKFISRQHYSSQRLQEHAHNHWRLMHEFNAQEVTFTTADNITLAGLLVIRPHAQRTWLICHGYRMAKERLLPFALIFADDNLLFFDHRAHGVSGGTLTSFGFHERKDVMAAIDFLTHHPAIAHVPLYGLGISMGAVSLLGAVGENNVLKALVLDSPFARLDEQIKRIVMYRYKFPRYFFPLLGRAMFDYQLNFSSVEVDAVAWAEKITIPIFFIHSNDDQVAFFQDSQQIHQCVKSKKDLWAVSSCPHAKIFVTYPDEYKTRVNQFLAQLDVR